MNVSTDPNKINRKELLGNYSYKMSYYAWKELLKRCKGSVSAAKEEISRGLNTPIVFRYFDKKNKKGETVGVYVTGKNFCELEEVSTFESILDEKFTQNKGSKRNKKGKRL